MSIEEPENRNGFTRIGEEDWAEIEQLAEAWVSGLPFESVYEFTKRFHVHLLTMMFCNEREHFEEVKADYKKDQESGTEEEEDVTTMLVKRLDMIVGFDGKIGEEMYLDAQGDEVELPEFLKNCSSSNSVQADEVELPDKEFFKKLGLD